MRQSRLKAALLGAVLLAAAGCAAYPGPASDAAAAGQLPPQARAALAAAIASPLRAPANVARDRYRHPAETLAFFGVRPSDTVVEIWPGGGWYSEILAPYLASGGGTLVAAVPAGNQQARFAALVASDPARFPAVRTSVFPAPAQGASGGGSGTASGAVADGSADVVLTFRNVHNWLMGDAPFADRAFAQMYAMLKPGGVLGVVDHRLPETADPARERQSGYVRVSTVRSLAEQAGFRYVGSSEVNANPADSADWPDGVWTLPPSLRLKDKDRERYLAIGESDRMTLKFVKPR